MEDLNSVEDKDKVLHSLGEDYADYLMIDLEKERTSLNSSLDAMLNQMHEYGVLLERTSNENKFLLNERIPTIFLHYQKLQHTFKNIDKIESLISRMKHDLNNMEKAMVKAEVDSGISHSLTHVMKPFFFMKDPTPGTSSSEPVSQIDIFKMEDFFKAEETDKLKEEVASDKEQQPKR